MDPPDRVSPGRFDASAAAPCDAVSDDRLVRRCWPTCAGGASSTPSRTASRRASRRTSRSGPTTASTRRSARSTSGTSSRSSASMRLQRAGGQPVARRRRGDRADRRPVRPVGERPLLDRAGRPGERPRHPRPAGPLPRLRPGPTQALVVNNLDWLGETRLLDFLRDVGKHFTVPYMLAKDSVQARLAKGLSLHRVQLHAPPGGRLRPPLPLARGGAAVRRRRPVGQHHGRPRADPAHGTRPSAGGREPAHGLAYPLLLSPSGAKFGKSEAGESIWLDPALTSPYRFYQYWVDADDRDVGVYLRWFTLFDRGRIEELEAEQAAAPGAARRPARAGPRHHGADPRAGRGRARRPGERDPVRRRPGRWPTPQTLADLAAEIPTAPWPEGGAVAGRGRRSSSRRGAAGSRARRRAGWWSRAASTSTARPVRGLAATLRPPTTSSPGDTCSSGGASATSGCSCAGVGRSMRRWQPAGHVQVISGCMFSGKTDELLRLLRRAEIARRRILLVRPRIDDRTERGGRAQPVRRRLPVEGRRRPVGDRDARQGRLGGRHRDRGGPVLPGRASSTSSSGWRAPGGPSSCCGLNTDFRGRPFGPMPRLLAIADDVTVAVRDLHGLRRGGDADAAPDRRPAGRRRRAGRGRRRPRRRRRRRRAARRTRRAAAPITSCRSGCAP